MGGVAERLDLVEGVVRLRSPLEDDLDPLVEMWNTPEVSRWWPDQTRDSISTLLTDDPDIVPLVIEVEGTVAGFLQIWENDDPEYRHAGLDLALHPRFQGQGLGPAAIRMACRWLFGHGHHRVTIDPAAENARARRAYEKVGFREVGRLRGYQWDPTRADWVDGILYDLLEDDLT